MQIITCRSMEKYNWLPVCITGIMMQLFQWLENPEAPPEERARLEAHGYLMRARRHRHGAAKEVGAQDVHRLAIHPRFPAGIELVVEEQHAGRGGGGADLDMFRTVGNELGDVRARRGRGGGGRREFVAEQHRGLRIEAGINEPGQRGLAVRVHFPLVVELHAGQGTGEFEDGEIARRSELRADAFRAHTHVFKRVERAEAALVKGYVLDLRNNPGGLLDQSISVSDAFLEKGEIGSTRGRNTAETQRFNVRAGDLTKKVEGIKTVENNITVKESAN